jgi:putative flippase GtrA
VKKYPFRFIFNKLTKKQKEVLKFLSVGVLCLSFNTIILYVFIEVFKIQYLIATIVGFFLSNLLGFFLNKYFTFQAFNTNIVVEIIKYFSVMGSSFTVNLLLMIIFVEIFKIWEIYASLIIAVMLTIYNYLLHKKWSFKHQKKEKFKHKKLDK